MANIRTLAESMFYDQPPGTKFNVDVDTPQIYETIRTQLVKLWSKHKEDLSSITAEDDPTLGLSLCSSHDKVSKQATFWLGKSRRKEAMSFSFTVQGS